MNFLSFYWLTHFYQVVENSGKHMMRLAAVFVFNSACKRLLAGLRVIKKSESICINSLFIPFTHLTHSVLSSSSLLCCSALTMHFLWLLSSKSAVSWGSNSVRHCGYSPPFPKFKINFFLFVNALNSVVIKSSVPFCFSVQGKQASSTSERIKSLCVRRQEKRQCFLFHRGLSFPFPMLLCPWVRRWSAVLQDHQCNWNKLSFRNMGVDTMEGFIDISKPL